MATWPSPGLNQNLYLSCANNLVWQALSELW